MLAPDASRVISVRYQPAAVEPSQGELTISSDAVNTPAVTLMLEGSGVAPAAPQMTLEPEILEFGQVEIGKARSLMAMIRNLGTALLTVTELAIEPAQASGFELANAPAVPLTVAAGESLTLDLVFRPIALGAAAGTFRVRGDDPNASEAVMSLGGMGIEVAAPQLTVEPAEGLGFGDVEVGQSQSLMVMVGNTGTADLTLTGFNLTADSDIAFELGATPPVPVPLVPGAQVMVEVQYSPSDVSENSGTLRVTTDIADTPTVDVQLSGSGIPMPMPALTVTPEMLAFGQMEVGQSSILSVTLMNSGTATLEIDTVGVTSNPPDEFVLLAPPQNLMSIEPGDSVTLDVQYQPTLTVPATGALQFSSNDPAMPDVMVPLSGQGMAVAVPQVVVDPESVAFNPVTVGQSEILPLTVRNPGTAALQLLALTLDSSAPGVFTLVDSPTFPIVIAPAGERVLNLAFQPTAPGTATAAIELQTNVATMPIVMVSLTGTGLEATMPLLQIQPEALAFGDVVTGQSVSLPITFTNAGTDELIVTALALERAVENAAGQVMRLGPVPATPFTVPPGQSPVGDGLF